MQPLLLNDGHRHAAHPARMPDLTMISSSGVGPCCVDLAAAQAHCTAVGHAPEVLANCVADAAWGPLVDAARAVSATDRCLRQGHWPDGPARWDASSAAPAGALWAWRTSVAKSPDSPPVSKMAGAGLDVFENEPQVPAELMLLDNVVVVLLLPQVASASVQTRQAMADRVVDKLKSVFTEGRLVSAAPSA